MNTSTIANPITLITNPVAPAINIAPWHTSIFMQGLVFVSLATITSIFINHLRRNNDETIDFLDKAIEWLPEQSLVNKIKPVVSLLPIIGISALYANAASCSLKYYFDGYITKLANAVFQNATANKVFTIFLQSLVTMIFPLTLSLFFVERHLTCVVKAKNRYETLLKRGEYGFAINEEDKLGHKSRTIKETQEEFWYNNTVSLRYISICAGSFVGVFSKSLLLDLLQGTRLPKLLRLGIAFGASSILSTAIAMLPDIVEAFGKEGKTEKSAVILRCASGIMINAILTALIQGILFNGLLGQYFNKSGYACAFIEGITTLVISSISAIGSMKIANAFYKAELYANLENFVSDCANYTTPLFIL